MLVISYNSTLSRSTQFTMSFREEQKTLHFLNKNFYFFFPFLRLTLYFSLNLSFILLKNVTLKKKTSKN